MASHENTALYHVGGATPVKRSTMSDANSKRALASVQRAVQRRWLPPSASRTAGGRRADAVRLIDYPPVFGSPA